MKEKRQWKQKKFSEKKPNPAKEKILAIKKKLEWLDPFTYVDLFILPRVHALKEKQQLVVFAASYIVLLLLVSVVLGAVPFFLLALSALYAYLFFFEKKEATDWGVYLLSAFVFAWAIYSAFGFALGTNSPMIIVMSGSMEPLYHRGDVVVLQGIGFEEMKGQEILLEQAIEKNAFASFAKPNYSFVNGQVQIVSLAFNNGQTVEIEKNGSIVVYFSNYLQQPIIHRVVAKLKAKDGNFVLTKGDSINNNTIDQDCGQVIYGRPERQCINLYPINEKEIQGKALFHVPLIGCAKLWLFDDLSYLIAKGKLPPDFKGFC